MTMPTTGDDANVDDDDNGVTIGCRASRSRVLLRPVWLAGCWLGLLSQTALAETFRRSVLSERLQCQGLTSVQQQHTVSTSLVLSCLALCGWLLGARVVNEQHLLHTHTTQQTLTTQRRRIILRALLSSVSCVCMCLCVSVVVPHRSGFYVCKRNVYIFIHRVRVLCSFDLILNAGSSVMCLCNWEG